MQIRHWIGLMALLPLIACGEYKVEGGSELIIDPAPNTDGKTGGGSAQGGDQTQEGESKLIEVNLSEETATIRMTGELASTLFESLQVESVQKDQVLIKDGESISCELAADQSALCQLDINLLTGGAAIQRDVVTVERTEGPKVNVELRLTNELAIQLHDKLVKSTSVDIRGFNVRQGEQVICMSAADTADISELSNVLDYTTLCKFTINRLGGLITLGEVADRSAEVDVENLIFTDGVLDEDLIQETNDSTTAPDADGVQDSRETATDNSQSTDQSGSGAQSSSEVGAQIPVE